MAKLRKAALVAIVWLTSALTVAAGMPEMVCRCAQSQPVTPTPAGRTSACSCNCGGQCCAGNSRSCCESTKESNSQPRPANTESRIVAQTAEEGPAISLCTPGGKCLRSLAANTVLSDRGKKDSSREFASANVAVTGTILEPPLTADRLPVISRDRSSLFSNDLITALQRLNI